MIKEITIREENLTQAFESCLEESGKGNTVQLAVPNPEPGSRTYFTLQDNLTGAKYETLLDISPNALRLDEIYWPPTREGWLAGNFTSLSGPAPEWQTGEMPRQLLLTVATVNNAGEVRQESYLVNLAETRSASVDFPEQAMGRIVSPYPEFWEIVVEK